MRLRLPSHSVDYQKIQSQHCIFVFCKSTVICWSGFCSLISRVKVCVWEWVAAACSESCCCSLFRTMVSELSLGKQGHFRISVRGNTRRSACDTIDENLYPLSLCKRLIQKRERRVFCGNGRGNLKVDHKAREHLLTPKRSGFSVAYSSLLVVWIPLDMKKWQCDRNNKEWWWPEWAGIAWQQGHLFSEVETANR